MRQRAGMFLMLIGLVLAGLATLLVMNIARQAAESNRGAIRQVALVAATRDIPDQSLIPADALVVKPFPADFAPVGSITSPDQVVGKIANGFIARDQVIVANQVSTVRRSTNLSDRIPPGKVVIWLAMPDLLASAGLVKPGDHVDILLTLPIINVLAPVGPSFSPSTSSGPGLVSPTAANEGAAANQQANQSTQTTLQNVEVYGIGGDEVSRAAIINNVNGQPTPPDADPNQTAPNTGTGRAQPQVVARPAIGFLVDHQDAVIIKFIKDSGGVIDLAVRSSEEQQIVRTDAMTADAIAERFRFRVPRPVAP
jgi:pilus assembly protein CpaB